jgi:hypothetical protein
MSFGKYKGRLVSEIPLHYLRWLAANVDIEDPRLRQAVHEALRYREAHHAHQAPPEPARPALDAKSVIGRWYNEMVMKYHPDRFGSHEAMTAINHAHDRLRQLAGLQ